VRVFYASHVLSAYLTDGGKEETFA